jgi:two-component system cell cycle sensor histidine kinase/response regulator CckA
MPPRSKGGRLTVCLNKLSIDTPSEAQKHCVTPGAYLELCVQDTGYGISPAQIKRIFEPYYTTKPKGKGTGMGLAVVHGIVTSHGGTIAAESHPGHGSIFRILLPITNRKHEIREAKEQVLPRGHERILFVDDEEYLADVGHRMLSRLGYSVTCCTDPLAALEVIKSRCAEFDLLITDTTMPHMSGDALAKEAMQIKPDLPVIMCTGYSEQITAEKAARLGIASFLMKPIAISDLACTLRGVLDPLSKQHATPTGTYGDEILAN